MTHDQRTIVEELFAAYSRGVGSFVLARVGDAELAEEITSRVFVAVVESVNQCHGPPAAWLWAIVRNEIAMHFRSRRLPARELDDNHRDPRTNPEQSAEACETLDQIGRALQRLPDDWQRIVWMKFFQDMQNTEIAEATGLTPGHVGVLVHRALRELRALMTEPVREAANATRQPEFLSTH